MIEVKNITKSYGLKTVLRDFSIEFNNNGVTAILGVSGTGKSTLLRCINALETVDQGDIIVNGRSVLNKANYQIIRQECGMVFQQTALFPQLNVLENLTMSPMKLLHMEKGAAEDKAMSLLKKVDLGDKSHSAHNELSGGEKQRIAIARALMMSPKALLLDEITSALDPEMTTEVLLILEKLAADGMCMLAVTHEMSFAQRVATRIVFMDEARIACDTSAEDFFSSERNHNGRIEKFLESIGTD